MAALLALPSSARANPFLLYEPATGEIIDYEDADRYWHPASLTKLMTAYLTFEAVKAGKLKWEDKLEFSAKARAQPATRIGLRPGIDVTIAQAVRGLILRSANDFAMALAEAVSGSEEAFVAEMNAAADRLGMKRTHFVNPHGLPEPEQVTTARDMALLTSTIIKSYPEQADVFSAQQMGLGKATLTTVNTVLRMYQGADGMKTGFTCSSGYNIVASASRNGRRMVAVLLGEVSSDERNRRAGELLTLGFERGTAKAPPLGDARVFLTTLPYPPMEPIPAEDLSHFTRTYKCGNGGGGVAARATGGVRVAQTEKHHRGHGGRKH